MRLRLLTVVGTMALALAAPSAALAHHGHHHHHSNKSKAHHAKFRVENITPSGTVTPATPGGSVPTTSPTEENAGTVASFENEVLTVTLKDGSTVSGKVTSDTRIRCVSPGTTSEPATEGSGDDNGAGDDQSRGDMSQSGEQKDGAQNDGEQKDGGDDNGEAPATAPEPPCDTSSLVKGAVVRAGQLRIGPSGNEWEFVVLVRP